MFAINDSFDLDDFEVFVLFFVQVLDREFSSSIK